MQRMFDPKCTPEEYQKQGKSYLFPDLTGELCPQCMADKLRKHGYYLRWLCVIDFRGDILIRRHICKTCGKTVSLLPCFAHPRIGYGIQFIIGILNLFYLDGSSVSHATNAFNKNNGPLCSRQLLRHFRRRLEGNINRLIMEIIALLKLQSPPVTAQREEKRKRARQFLEYIHSFDPKDVSLKLFEHSGTTILTPLTQ